jgi:hypothetical protein
MRTLHSIAQRKTGTDVLHNALLVTERTIAKAISAFSFGTAYDIMVS